MGNHQQQHHNHHHNWNPFSVESKIPWIVIFNIITWGFVFILDAAIGESFNNQVKAGVCLTFYILNISFFFYTVVIYISIIYNKVTIFTTKYFRKNHNHSNRILPLYNNNTNHNHHNHHDINKVRESFNFINMLNIFFGNGLSWTWIFVSLYFFNNSYYISNIQNTPRLLIEIAFRFWSYTILLGFTAGFGSIIPAFVVVEFFSALCVLSTQLTLITLVSVIVCKMFTIFVSSSSNYSKKIDI